MTISYILEHAINITSSIPVLVFLYFLPSNSSKVLRGDGLVGGNPTMNTPRLRRGGG